MGVRELCKGGTCTLGLRDSGDLDGNGIRRHFLGGGKESGRRVGYVAHSHRDVMRNPTVTRNGFCVDLQKCIF